MAPSDAPPDLLRRVARTGILVPVIAVTWLGGGLVTNFLQLLLFVGVRPWSRALFVYLNSTLVWWWWVLIMWAMDWWAEWDIRYFCPNGDFEELKAENALVLANHYGDVDWAMGWLLAERCGALGNAKAYMKYPTKFLPIIGWSWYFSDYVFLDRDWNKDKARLKQTFAGLTSYPSDQPFWLGLFCEGTRRTPAKLAESQAWCREHGKPELQHVLWPRTKGFASTVIGLEGKLDAVYSFNICCPDKNRMPTFAGLFKTEPASFQMSLRRWDIKDLPKEEDALKEWCCQRYIETDQLLDQCVKEGRFPGVERKFPRRVWGRVSVWFWTIFVQGTLLYLLLTSSSLIAYGILSFYVGISVLLIFIIRYAEVSKSQKKPPVGDTKKRD